MFTMKAGNSADARYENVSCIKLIPGLEDEVIARFPAATAPYIMLAPANSLSLCKKRRLPLVTAYPCIPTIHFAELSDSQNNI